MNQKDTEMATVLDFCGKELLGTYRQLLPSAAPASASRGSSASASRTPSRTPSRGALKPQSGGGAFEGSVPAAAAEALQEFEEQPARDGQTALPSRSVSFRMNPQPLPATASGSRAPSPFSHLVTQEAAMQQLPPPAARGAGPHGAKANAQMPRDGGWSGGAVPWDPQVRLQSLPVNQLSSCH